MADGDLHSTIDSARRARVLVAEDDDDMRSLLVDVLVRRGHEVRAVSNGAALLVELARADQFSYRDVQLVIADIRMPVCSGLDALRAVREAGAPLPFLLLTAFGDEATHAQAARLDALLLDKPVAIARLCDVLDAVLRAPSRG